MKTAFANVCTWCFFRRRNVNHNQLLWSQKSLSSVSFWLRLIEHQCIVWGTATNVGCYTKCWNSLWNLPGTFLCTQTHIPSHHWSVLKVTDCAFQGKWLLLRTCYWSTDFLTYLTASSFNIQKPWESLFYRMLFLCLLYILSTI